ncbi:MAG: tRNA (adenosine(37)-N6)-dimethylallyltransferase MiaA, partial [Clostridia bacterium]|nr:tRNA (adenosine(37)-N6)-dimethylallyltransferase MiaA [Clostridia bacterium]
MLYARIDRRVDEMLASGLVEEARALDADGIFERSPTAAGAIGYKELLPYLRGECSLQAATDELKTATRRYAKRQMTWFGAKEYVQWLDMNEGNSLRKSEEIVNNALSLAENAWNML